MMHPRVFLIVNPKLKKILNNLYSRSCENHEGQLFMWLQADQREKELMRLKKEVDGCGACGP